MFFTFTWSSRLSFSWTTNVSQIKENLKGYLRIFIERSIVELQKIYINAGKRGLLAEVSPANLARVLDLSYVDVAN